jgi:hypothetical protein
MTSSNRDLEFGPLPKWLRQAVDAVLADLQQPTPINVRLQYEPASGILWVSEAGESLMGCGPWGEEERGVWLLVDLADELQEQFFPETRGAWGQARPECPGHPHPAHPEEIDGEAWWICPADGRQIAVVGRLGQ